MATGSFREDSKLGRGGSGNVYRGVLPSGIPVAVKKLNADSRLGKSVKVFKDEVRIEEKERSYSVRDIATSGPTKKECPETLNHSTKKMWRRWSGKKMWWRWSGKKIRGEPLSKPIDDRTSGKKIGCRIGCGPGRNEKSITVELEGLPAAQRFSYKELRAATASFSEKSKLGTGSFGTVYRGKLPSGISVAIRKMKMIGTEGEATMFNTELFVLSQIKHENVIELLGWGEDLGKKEYFLVYELMRNGSLEDVLFGEADKEIVYGNLADVLLELAEAEITCLSCQQRFNILTGIATALNYLHQSCDQKIIHRNIKARNVLLDEKWNVKLAGFGHSILVDNRGQIVFEEIIKGTLVYISPEYQSEGIVTDKMDVYSFGVLVLEVVCGRQAYSRDLPKGEAYVTEWVHQRLSQGQDLHSLVDKRVGDYDTRSMEKLLIVGYSFNESTLSSDSGPDRDVPRSQELTWSKRLRRRMSLDRVRNAKASAKVMSVHVDSNHFLQACRE